MRAPLLVLAFAFAAAPPAGAVSESSPLTIPTAAFLDTSPLEGWALQRSITQGSLTGTGSGATGTTGVAGVHLPDGARVTALVGGFLDEDGNNDNPLILYRRRISTSAALILQEMARVAPTGSSPAVQVRRDETIEFGTIDNSLYVYWVAAFVDPDNTQYSVQIEFVRPIFVDGFESGDTSAWSSSMP